ncbi:glycosyltransferase family A protein [Polaribacter aquimarinus]|uniref:Glycosyltransferase 2-like domain-containing protein n=1 Tax=Polaribacter aquimarinus TaxID=2100726 RepID=A0A2U2J7H5_9FLAO|nr:glycosyltransferase family A protein [Polaribacter aquimarinus]PWG04277.1 hypothetical protein DIS07_12755 [Polaribacter aquimarinus]
MRIGTNPNIHKEIDILQKSHRVIIPVYIPNFEGYFKDSLNVFKVCIESLLLTINTDTVISVISNASCDEVNQYIFNLKKEKKIDRAIFNEENVGKMNAIIAEARASFEDIITFSDADVFFDKNWLSNTFNIFNNFPKAGLVSMNPMPGSYGFAASTIFSNIFVLKKEKTSELCSFSDLENFHKSIGRDKKLTEQLYNKNIAYLKSNNVNALIGAGHFCCTIKRTLTLNYVPKEKSNKAASGGSETKYLDIPLDISHQWRLSSTKAYIWHMGNTLEKELYLEKLESLKSFKEKNFNFHGLMHDNSYLFSKFIPYKLKLKLVSFIKKQFLK